MKALPLTLAALLLFGTSCSRYGKRVPDEVLQKLPYESRIELLEAENELALAIDRRDEARSEVQRTRTALRRAKERLTAAERESSSAEAEAEAEAIAQLAVSEAQARVAYLRARQKVNGQRESLEELALDCARARFELARLNVARKAKVEGSEALDPQAFGAQIQSCEAQVNEERAVLAAEEQSAQTAKGQWEEQRQNLARKTFDARASPYVE